MEACLETITQNLTSAQNELRFLKAELSASSAYSAYSASRIKNERTRGFILMDFVIRILFIFCLFAAISSFLSGRLLVSVSYD
jgi:uncharacterized membrane protein